MPKTVTLADIATKCRLSIPTVSYALNGKGHLLRAQTCQRILEVARELGYRPNASARAVRTGRFGCIAMFTTANTYQTYLREGLLSGVQDVLDERDMHLIISRLALLSGAGDSAPKMSRQLFADGLLVNCASAEFNRVLPLVEQSALPYVWIHKKNPTDAAYMENVQASAEATRHLLQLGHRAIVYVGDQQRFSVYTMADRWEGHAQTMRQAGLTPQYAHPTGAQPARQWAALYRDWLLSGNRPTAIIAARLPHAQAIITAALQAGLRVPQDLSVITYAGELPVDSGLAVSAMVISRHELGRAATRLLLEKIDNPQQEIPSISIPFQFTPGDTTAPPASS